MGETTKLWSKAFRHVALVVIVGAGIAAVAIPVIRWIATTPPQQLRFESLPPIDSFAKYVTMAVLVLGVVASYVRFFHGRMFTARAIPATSVHVLRSQPDAEKLVHFVRFDVENKGTRRLKVKWVRLCTYFQGHAAVQGLTVHEEDHLLVNRPFDGYEGGFDALQDFRPVGSRVIDSGERDTFLFLVPVDAKTNWVVHQARVKCGRHDWRHAVAVANKPTRNCESSSETASSKPNGQAAQGPDRRGDK